MLAIFWQAHSAHGVGDMRAHYELDRFTTAKEGSDLKMFECNKLCRQIYSACRGMNFF